MSKKSRSTRRTVREVSTTTPPFANADALDWAPDPPRSVPDVSRRADRRNWYPDPLFQPAQTLSKLARLYLPRPKPQNAPRARKQALASTFQQGLAFQAPRQTLVCIRRKVRAEVMHALGKTGKGGGRKRRPRRNDYSSVICRR